MQGKTGEGEPDAINVAQMLSQGQLPALVAGTAPVQARTSPCRSTVVHFLFLDRLFGRNGSSVITLTASNGES